MNYQKVKICWGCRILYNYFIFISFEGVIVWLWSSKYKKRILEH